MNTDQKRIEHKRKANIGAYARRMKREGKPYLSRAERVCLAAERLIQRIAERAAGTRQAIVERLRIELPEVHALHVSKPLPTQYWHARYNLDPEFKAREIERARRKKAHRSGIVMRSDGSMTGSVVQGMFSSAHRCPECRRRMGSLDKSLDHIVPVSKGGTHSVMNCRVICKRCNSRKGHSLPEQPNLTHPCS